jgi:hypothetical protein
MSLCIKAVIVSGEKAQILLEKADTGYSARACAKDSRNAVRVYPPQAKNGNGEGGAYSMEVAQAQRLAVADLGK